MTFPRRALGATLLSALCASAGHAQDDAGEVLAPSPAPEMVLVGGRPPRADLALVLSGGGARGAAHIGVLEVLEREHVVPDLIVGTSMGAIVGGLYAAGYSPAEIGAVLEEIDWGEVFISTARRDQRSFRRKEDDRVYLIPLSLHFKGAKMYLPSGVLGGGRLELLLESLVMQATTATDFDELPIPFRCVAADVDTGEVVVLGEGRLAQALRASMSIAGALAPVAIDGRRLVDGGAVANVPVGVAQALGAERVIVVDISSPLADDEEQSSSFLGVLSRMSGLLTTGNRAVDLRRLGPADLLIKPDLDGISFSAFAKAGEAVEHGRAAAEAAVERIAEFAAEPDAWERFASKHVRDDATRLPLARTELRNESWVDDRVVLRRLDVPLGEPLDAEALLRHLQELHALEYFGNLHHDYVPEAGGGTLVLDTPRKPHGRNSVRFGLSLQSDFAGESNYALTARHRALALNRRGGELVNVVQLGSDNVMSSEFYQPLGYGHRWFVSPAVSLERRNQQLWIDEDPVSEYRISRAGTALEAGRVFGSWGELRAGVFTGRGEASLRIGPALVPEGEDDEGGWVARFRVDTLDSTSFPTRGASVDASIQVPAEFLGSDYDVGEIDVQATRAMTIGRETVVLRALASADFDEDGTLLTASTLGGLLRLSGLGPDELVGERGGLANVIFYHQIAWLQFGSLSNRIFTGISFEAGNLYAPNESLTWDSLRYGGCVFAGADTVAGPAFLGWGWTEPDRSHLYFALGRRF
jgi:NTE family protein